MAVALSSSRALWAGLQSTETTCPAPCSSRLRELQPPLDSVSTSSRPLIFSTCAVHTGHQPGGRNETLCNWMLINVCKCEASFLQRLSSRGCKCRIGSIRQMLQHAHAVLSTAVRCHALPSVTQNAHAMLWMGIAAVVKDAVMADLHVWARVFP